MTYPLPSEISTSRKHSVDYFTTDGFVLRTAYTDIRNWYLLPLREGLDNAIDFEWKHYRGENASINVDIYKDVHLFRIRITNSNPRNIPVFQDLNAIFDYDGRYGSKQDVHVISRGMLGDAMKQIMSLGYILTHVNDDGTEFTDKQWEHPLIIRHNEEEYEIYLRYDKAKQQYKIETRQWYSVGTQEYTDTEIEIVLPIIGQARNTLDRSYIEKFCREYSILTTDISFKFSIVDDTTYTAQNNNFNKSSDLAKELIHSLSTSPSKGILNIEIPTLGPIATSKEWNNADSIHSYLPSEFTSRITNVHRKQETMVHDVLLNFREGTNLKKGVKTRKSVAAFLSDPNMYAEIEELFHELKGVLPAQKRISIPYSTSRNERIGILVPRIAELYDIDSTKRPSYRIEWGYYDNGILQYPFAFEILGIPFADPIKAETKFIGAVNYSISPNGIKLEGEYNAGGPYIEENINDILKSCGFHKHSAKKSRLPCVVIGNLITPRRDPYGYDKSRIDTKPYAKTIVTAVKKMASDIPTLRAAGYIIRNKDDDYRNARQKKINRKVSAKELLRKFLVKERGLVDV